DREKLAEPNTKGAFEDVVKKDKQALGEKAWDPKTKQFAKGNTYRDQVIELKKQVEGLQKTNKDLDERLVAANQREDRRDECNDTALGLLFAAAKEYNDEALDAAQQAKKAKTDVETEKTDTLSKFDGQIKKLQKELAEKERAYAKVLRAKDVEIARLLERKA